VKIFFRFVLTLGVFFLLLIMTLWPDWSVAAADQESLSVSSVPLMTHQLRAMTQITFTSVATVYLPYVNRGETAPDPDPTDEPGSADVKITTIMYNPDGDDDVGEYVDIKNFGGTVVITDWTLQDNTDKTFTFPSFTLNAEATVRVWVRDGVDDESNLYWGRTAVWNNTGDTATLRNAAGDLVDQCTYPGGAPGFVDCVSQ